MHHYVESNAFNNKAPNNSHNDNKNNDRSDGFGTFDLIISNNTSAAAHHRVSLDASNTPIHQNVQAMIQLLVRHVIAVVELIVTYSNNKQQRRK